MIEDWIDALTFSLPTIGTIKFKRDYTAKDIIKRGKVFLQDKRTVLRIGDDVFMSTPEKGEKYDAEKGVLICIMKAMGMSTSDFLKVFENAKDTRKGKKHKTR